MIERSKILGGYGDLKAGVGTREFGNMSLTWGDTDEVVFNRKAFLGELNIKIEDCVGTRLNGHTDVVEVVSENNKCRGMLAMSDGEPSDALITNAKGLGLFMFSGDCPIAVLYEPELKVLGMAHLSWQTTTKRLVQKTVAAMQEAFRCSPNDLLVYIGPGIQAGSYKFIDPAQKQMPEWKPFIKDLPNGETAIDLFAYNRRQLIEAGVDETKIEASLIDTATDERFYSHYRSARTGEPEGRFGTVAVMRR